MIIGILTEPSADENRVCLTPGGAAILAHGGHEVLVRYLPAGEPFDTLIPGLFELHTTMAMTITDECVDCGACEPECPREAIHEGDPHYYIDAENCAECAEPSAHPLPGRGPPKDTVRFSDAPPPPAIRFWAPDCTFPRVGMPWGERCSKACSSWKLGSKGGHTTSEACGLKPTSLMQMAKSRGCSELQSLSKLDSVVKISNVAEV